MGVALPHIDSADAEITWAAERGVSGEQRLWLAVLQRVVLDAFTASDTQIAVSESNKSGDFCPDIVRAECRRWLTADYVEDREHVCSLAGVEVDDVVRMARKRLIEVKAAPPKPELTSTERRRNSQRKYYRRVKEAKKHDLTLVQYDEMLAKRRAYNDECQRLKERQREKWAAIAAQNAAE